MRKLKTSDIGNFCVFLKATGARKQVANLLIHVAADFEKHKELLLDLAAKAEAGDAAAAEQYKQETDNFSWLNTVGLDGFLFLAECLAEKNAQNALYVFLGSVFGMTASEVENLELDILFDNFRKLFEVNNMFRFFSAAPRTGT